MTDETEKMMPAWAKRIYAEVADKIPGWLEECAEESGAPEDELMVLLADQRGEFGRACSLAGGISEAELDARVAEAKTDDDWIPVFYRVMTPDAWPEFLYEHVGEDMVDAFLEQVLPHTLVVIIVDEQDRMCVAQAPMFIGDPGELLQRLRVLGAPFTNGNN